jgi:capsular polysaccharide export protein
MFHSAPKPSGRYFFVGLRRWKAASLGPILSWGASPIQFVKETCKLTRVDVGEGDSVFVWGAAFSGGELDFVRERGAQILRVEDGFIRSVGLGSDFVKPLSLVVDGRGLYFDPSCPSDLEHLLNSESFSGDDLKKAAVIQEIIVRNGITKYNTEPRGRPSWLSSGKRIVLVPGQVEDDASILLGCSSVRTNLELLRAVRKNNPEAYIVYKPHPDVRSGNRTGAVASESTAGLADHIETQWSVVSCLDACAEVHTMTSLCGFDALLRGKKVVTYGQPFYAGWGLTHDMEAGAPAFARRLRRLTMDELVAGTLLRYPLYWDWSEMKRTTCESVLESITQARSRISTDNFAAGGRVNSFHRTIRKYKLVLASLFPRSSGFKNSGS